MFVKRIDMIGFKSFANETNIEFSPGFTAVVGPNGSGKSNIADAIRWVLGEQSARNLRGSKMEDVIFAGSETRKPINFCEVSLTLDNTDEHLPVLYNEVTVTRRVYRSGESEYLLNRQTCRLKDIAELFMDSGLGRDSYSIIGQGKIEEMLSTRPEDRRGPFEDAASIVKFKIRRKETERKLEETAANMVRVDDILAELTQQAGPLGEKAEQARVFQNLTKELTDLEISLLVLSIDELKARWQQGATDVGQLSLQRQEAAAQLKLRTEQLEHVELQLETSIKGLEALQRDLVMRVEERERAEGTIALLQERFEQTQQAITAKLAQMERIKEEDSQLASRLKDKEQQLVEIGAKLEVKAAALEVAAHAADGQARATLEAKISDLNAELIELHHDAAAHRNEIKSVNESLSLEKRQRHRLTEEVATWQTQISTIDADAAALQDKRAGITSQQQALSDEAREKDGERKALGDEEAAVARELHDLQFTSARLLSRLELLRDLEAGYDGYAQGVKTVLQSAAKNKLTGICGPIATLIAVDKAYEIAVETALGGGLQNIVVREEADARAAIALLKQRQAGRATFLPLSTVRTRSLASNDVQQARRQHGFVGIASELVTTEPEYRGVVGHLLGNIIVANTLIDAGAIAKAIGYRIRIVTLEGDVVSPGGAMSGGSFARKGPGLLGRSRERTDIEASLAANTQKRTALADKQNQLREQLATLENETRHIGELRAALQSELGKLDVKLRELLTKRTNAEDRLQALAWDVNQLDNGEVSWKERLESATSSLAIAQGRLTEIEAKLTQSRTELANHDEAMSRAQEAFTTYKVEVATLTQEQASTAAQALEIQKRAGQLKDYRGELNSDLMNLDRTLGETRDNLAAAREEVAQFAALVTEVEAAMGERRQARQAEELLLADAKERARVQQAAVASADEKLHRAEVLAERADVELNHALRKIGETYHMTYEWAKEHSAPITKPEDSRSQADALRRQIAGLGDVQVGAIQDFEQLTNRIDFLSTERSDLNQASLQLHDVIRQIDEEMAKRFSEAFEQIRSQFQIAFRQLFNGGKADLELTDPKDLLTTGIEIVAQPPGKKLQNLNLLSGGERALTAMALLFAILTVRPVPFCVLDEVEAALDEANVVRFAQQLRKFVLDTQFIVITHRRGTMEEADVLYGVTMQESGISSLVSVRLGDHEEPESE